MQVWPRLPALGGVLTVQLGPCYAPAFGCRCGAMAHLPSWGTIGCSWGFVYKPARYPLHVQNGDYKGKSLFQLFSAILGSSHLETGSCARWWHQCFVPTCLAAAGENAKMPETNDYLVVCLHTGLQLMCSMMYLTALVWLWCLHYKQECLTAQLM